jgi:hypothetical protein
MCPMLGNLYEKAEKLLRYEVNIVMLGNVGGHSCTII